MKDVSQGAFVAFGVLVKLAVIRTHLHLVRHYGAAMVVLGVSDVFL